MMIRQSAKRAEAVPERIVILRALQLGDLLCAVPAFRALRVALPAATITLIGLPWAREFVRRFSYYLDDFIEFPGFPGFPERTPQIVSIPTFLTEVQQLNFDLAIQMQGSGWLANSLVMLFGAILNAGFYLPGQYCPDPERFLEYPSHEHEITRHLKLMEFLGCHSQGQYLEFPLHPRDWQEFQQIENRHDLKAGEYICIHPGSRAMDRRWPSQHFVSIADVLAGRGYQIIFTGTEIEKPLIEKIRASIKFHTINLAGETTLGSVGALISKSRLLICNDTGVSHIAAGLQKPSVVLFSGSNPTRWAPLDRSLHRSIELHQNSASQHVLRAADELMEEFPVSPAKVNVGVDETSLI